MNIRATLNRAGHDSIRCYTALTDHTMNTRICGHWLSSPDCGHVNTSLSCAPEKGWRTWWAWRFLSCAYARTYVAHAIANKGGSLHKTSVTTGCKLLLQKEPHLSRSAATQKNFSSSASTIQPWEILSVRNHFPLSTARTRLRSEMTCSKWVSWWLLP